MDVRKRALAALVGLPVALCMVALAGSPAGAADEGSVLQGTWTINVTVVGGHAELRHREHDLDLPLR